MFSLSEITINSRLKKSKRTAIENSSDFQNLIEKICPQQKPVEYENEIEFLASFEVDEPFNNTCSQIESALIVPTNDIIDQLNNLQLNNDDETWFLSKSKKNLLITC